MIDCIETIEVCELKAGTYSRLSEYMVIHEYQRLCQFDLCSRSLRFYTFKLTPKLLDTST